MLVRGAVFEKQSKQWYSKPTRTNVSKILRKALSLPDNAPLKGVHMGGKSLKTVRSALAELLSPIPEAYQQLHFDRKVGDKNKKSGEEVLFGAAFCGRAKCTGHCKKEDGAAKDTWLKSGPVFCRVEVRFFLVVDGRGEAFVTQQSKQEDAKTEIEHAKILRAKKVGDKLYSALAMQEGKVASLQPDINKGRKRQLKDPVLQARQQAAREGVIEIAPEKVVKKAKKNQDYRDRAAGQAAADFTKTDWKAHIQELLARYETNGFSCKDYEPVVLQVLRESVIFTSPAQLKLLHWVVEAHREEGVPIGQLYDGTFPDYATLLNLGVSVKRWDKENNAFSRSCLPIVFCFAGGGEKAELVQPLAEAISAAYGRMFDVPADFLMGLTKFCVMDGHPGATLGILRAWVKSDLGAQIHENNKFISANIERFAENLSQPFQEL